MKQKRYLIPAVQEGLLFLLLSGWLMWYSLDAHGRSYIRDWAQSPSLFPLTVAALLGVLALITLCRGLWSAQAEGKASPKHAVQVLILLALSLAYYGALAVIELPYMAVTVCSMTFTFSAFELATAVFLLLMMLYLGVRSKPVLVALPLGMTLFLSVMFRTLLHVLLP